MTTLSNGPTVITPHLVLGWDSARESRTHVHPVLGRPDPEVTVRPAALRAGTLRLFFLTYAEAAAAEAAHAEAGVWDLDATPDTPGLVGRYVVAGPLALRTDGEAHARWLLEVGFQEVGP